MTSRPWTHVFLCCIYNWEISIFKWNQTTSYFSCLHEALYFPLHLLYIIPFIDKIAGMQWVFLQCYLMYNKMVFKIYAIYLYFVHLNVFPIHSYLPNFSVTGPAWWLGSIDSKYRCIPLLDNPDIFLIEDCRIINVDTFAFELIFFETGGIFLMFLSTQLNLVASPRFTWLYLKEGGILLPREPIAISHREVGMIGRCVIL